MLIIIEGIDQSGKTTFAKKLCERIINSKYYHFPNYEVSSGKLIQKVLQGEMYKSPESLQRLYKINRTETMSLIQKDLNEGKNVICDRYSYSGYIYSLALGLDDDFARDMKRDVIKPNIKIYLKCPIEITEKRRELKDINDIYENLYFQKKVEKIFDEYIDDRLDKWLVLDHESSLDYNLSKVMTVYYGCYC